MLNRFEYEELKEQYWNLRQGLVRKLPTREVCRLNCIDWDKMHKMLKDHLTIRHINLLQACTDRRYDPTRLNDAIDDIIALGALLEEEA